jgi:2-polyprenyl-3-methyl-5-hydroxy-6-metoxy-1,4-benzoquinol methylase
LGRDKNNQGRFKEMNKDKQNEILKIVRNNYEEIAESFDETREKPIWPPLLELLKKVGRGERVLDVGCGNGRLLKGLSEQGAEYVGVDQSRRLIDICRQKYPKGKFECLDVANLGALSEYDFDWVFCVAVLHHLPGFDQRLNALKQLKNKIKDNGKVVVTVWNMWSEDKFRNMIWKFFLLKLMRRNTMDFGDVLFDWKRGGVTSKRYYHAFQRHELKRLVRSSGLRVENIFRDRFNYYLVLVK